MRDPGEGREEATRDVPSGERGRVLRFSSLAPGALFADRYLIAESLGAGGSGEVFRARDRVAGHDVALKVLFPRAAEGDEHLDRPRRELGILRGLSHPGIVRVFDMGEHDGLVYLVMDLLEGETLRARLERVGRMGEEEALRILRGALDALAAAHEAGVVHRDIKPGNIFLARGEGGDERVVLLDFGLARRTADATLTATGAFLGTPEYVSPEQARGDEKIGPPSDLYSLGVTIWEVLAGRTPFEGASQLEILRQKLAGKPLVEDHSLKRASPGPRVFLQRVLAFDPARRPRDAAAARIIHERLGLRGGRASLVRSVLTGALSSRGFLPAIAFLLLAAAIFFGGFFPWRLETRGEHLSIRGILGQEIAPVETGYSTNSITPLSSSTPWSRHYLVGESGDARLSRMRGNGLRRFDILTRELTDFRLTRGEASYRIESGFENYDDRMGAVRAKLLPDTHPRTNSPLFYVGYQHSGHYPSLTLFVEEDGNVIYQGWHAGDIKQFLTVGRDSRAWKNGVVALGRAVANQLSARSTAFAFPRVSTLAKTSFEAPPFVRKGPRSGANLPYYLFFSNPTGADFLTLEGDEGVFRSGGRVVSRFDLATGVPVDAAYRDGLSAETWLRRHDELIDLLKRAALSHGPGTERVADELAHYASLKDVARPERGVALARAAEMYRSHGEIELALELAEQAVTLEPGLTGHARLHADLLYRMRGFQALVQEYVELGSESANVPIVHDAVTMAALMSERATPSARPLVLRWIEGRVGPFSKRWVLLHFAGEAAVDLQGHRIARDEKVYPEYAFVSALEEFVTGDREAARAHELIAPHETQFGAGALAPIVPLRAFLAARGHGDAPPREEVDAALEAQRVAGREDLRSLYWVPWADALAAGAARAEGDLERYETLRARAEKAPGAGPWLESLLSD